MHSRDRRFLKTIVSRTYGHLLTKQSPSQLLKERTVSREGTGPLVSCGDSGLISSGCLSPLQPAWTRCSPGFGPAGPTHCCHLRAHLPQSRCRSLRSLFNFIFTRCLPAQSSFITCKFLHFHGPQLFLLRRHRAVAGRTGAKLCALGSDARVLMAAATLVT